MPTLAAKIAVATAATVLTWAGIEAIRFYGIGIEKRQQPLTQDSPD